MLNEYIRPVSFTFGYIRLEYITARQPLHPHPAHPPSPPSQPTPPPAHPPFLFRFTSPSRSQLGSGSRSQLGPGAVAVGRPVPERTRTQVSGKIAARVRVGGEAGGSGQAGGAELSRRGRRWATDSEGPRRLRRAGGAEERGGETKRLDSGVTAAHGEGTGQNRAWGPRHLQP